MGKSLNLGIWSFGLPGFISMWVFLNGFIFQNIAGLLMIILGSTGFISIFSTYIFHLLKNKQKKEKPAAPINPLTGFYYSVEYKTPSPFVPSRQDFAGGSAVCSKCGVDVPKSYVACWSCGTFLNRYHGWKHCRVCGKVLPESVETCDGCGLSLNGLSTWK